MIIVDVVTQKEGNAKCRAIESSGANKETKENKPDTQQDDGKRFKQNSVRKQNSWSICWPFVWAALLSLAIRPTLNRPFLVPLLDSHPIRSHPFIRILQISSVSSRQYMLPETRWRNRKRPSFNRILDEAYRGRCFLALSAAVAWILESGTNGFKTACAYTLSNAKHVLVEEVDVKNW